MIKHILLCFAIGGIIGALLMLLAVKVSFGDEVPKNAFYGQKKAIVEEAWTDNEIVSAIYWAEGGDHAAYPYGIRSIKCETKKECKEICKNTVRNNRIRFRRQNRTRSFIAYLGNKYCPVGAENDKKNVNKNWLKNVTWYLNHPKKES